MSTNTGTMPYSNTGLTVGKAGSGGDETSSPGLSWRSRIMCEVRAEKATRLADDPELTVSTEAVPMRLANLAWKASLKRPDVARIPGPHRRATSCPTRRSCGPTPAHETARG